jgi:hypothetical protein
MKAVSDRAKTETKALDRDKNPNDNENRMYTKWIILRSTAPSIL